MAGNLSSKLPWELANPKWAATLNPVLNNPILNGVQLDGVVVKTGTNAINHTLQRALQGYFVVMNNAAITYHDSQSTNSRPDLTLLFVSSGAATISLYVY